MKKTGDLGEILSIEYLKRNGYSILDTNFKFSTLGEIDIIARKWEKTYFIEVKYRKNDLYGTWEESLTQNKLFKIQKTIDFYCLKYNIDREKIQFDVISILKQETSHRLTHYKNQSLWR